MTEESTAPADANVHPVEGRQWSSSTPLTIKLARWALPGILVLFIIVFSILEPNQFFTTQNLRIILTQQSVLAILAIGVCLPLIIGQFDLSVGAVMGLGVILVTGLPSQQGIDVVPAVAITLAACALIGLINGLFVAKIGVNAFIVTLGSSTVISGSVLWYSGGNTFTQISSGLRTLGGGDVGGVPNVVIVLAVVATTAWFLLEMTPVGRYLYAVGGSRDAARLAGLDVATLTILAFTLTGLISGLAGVLEASTLGSGSPTVGPPFLLPAFAAAFLGATAIKPGSFNILGTVFAVFTIQTGIVGLELVGVPYFIEPVFTGGVLIIAVVVTRILYREAL